MGQTDTVCPHCHYDFPAHELATAGPRGGKSSSRRGLKFLLMLLLVALVVFFIYLIREFRQGLHDLPN